MGVLRIIWVKVMFIADLHIHSRYSRATSKDSGPETLDFWARRKGIGLIGTGDFTHPAWREELKAKLVPAQDGLYVLRDGLRRPDPGAPGESRPRFVVSGEISSIYKKNGRVRKIHNLILLPGLSQADAVAKRLEAIGNLHSDGRPILGLDSRDLLEIVLETCPKAILVPAHIWTPHFSLFGAFSGFDTIEECFEDMTPYIHALETGLSSDPPMNWRLSALDAYTLISNSDAHSPQKLGREANIFDAPLCYDSLYTALARPGGAGMRGTIEFFPEEGKYHLDGHRSCGLRLDPSQSEAFGGVCPVCGKKLTIGVLHRVQQLADRPQGAARPDPAPFESLIPLPEIIASATSGVPTGAKVRKRYEGMLEALGSEFYILRQAPLEDIRRAAGPCIEEGIRRVREGIVRISPGYDGEYGRLGVLDETEIGILSGQLCLFEGIAAPCAAPVVSVPNNPPRRAAGTSRKKAAEKGDTASRALVPDLNERQAQAAACQSHCIAVIAGPGTGKTKTLVSRIVYLVKGCGCAPDTITAVTFTNKAAAQLRARLEAALGGCAVKLHIGTFHSLCLQLLSPAGQPVPVMDEYEALAAAAQAAKDAAVRLSARQALDMISRVKCGLLDPGDAPCGLCESYQAVLDAYGVLDYDDILLRALSLFEREDAPRDAFSHLLVDEFQDISDVQYRLIDTWSREGTLFAIGDPDQSIYGFRGASAQCFDRLIARRSGTQVFRLQEHYRCTPQILGSALHVINRSPQGGERLLVSQRDGGGRVRLITAADDFGAAIFIAKEINRLVGGIDMLDTESIAAGCGRGPIGFSDIAVLYRTHRQAEVLEKCLRIEGIPYLVAGREGFLSDERVRGVLGFFRHLSNPRDLLSLYVCLSLLMQCPQGAAREFISKLAQMRREAPQPLPLLDGLPPDALSAAPGLARWAELYGKYAPRIGTEKPHRLIEFFLADMALAADAAPLERLLNMAVLFEKMPAFLQNLTLGREGDLTRSGARAYQPDAVTLTTLHGAKGLEFSTVFLTGVRKGLLPLEAPGRQTDAQEERRLFYVGMTRARDTLLLIHSGEPSPFLSDIPAELLDKGDIARPAPPAPSLQMSLF